jgi:hypothetical protein
MKRIAIVVLICLASVAQAETSLFMQSDAGDWVGRGVTYSYDEKDAEYSLQTWWDGEAVSIHVNDADYTFWWTLDFGALDGTVLEPRAYKNATRYPFNEPTEPGLAVGGNGRGCNEVTGEFTVHQIEFDGEMNVTSLWISFEQHCEGDPERLWGTIKVNASPTPTASESWGRLKSLYGSD